MHHRPPVRIPFTTVASVLLCLSGTQPAWPDALPLDTCVAIALQRNPEIRAADREVDAARARLGQARALESPTLSYEAGKLGTAVSGEERETALRLFQELPFPTQRSTAARVAGLEIALGEANRESAALRIRGEVTRAYRRLQADALTLRTLVELRSTATDLEGLVQVRLRTGGARYLDVLRARAERARIENDIVEAERALHEDRRTLNNLMARAPTDPLDPADSLVFVPLADSLPGILEQARQTRPRLRAARLEVDRGAAAMSQAKSALLPSAAFGVGLDRVPGAEKPGLGAGVALTLPFAPWTNRRAKIHEASALKGSAEARLEATERSLESTVRNAYQSAQASAEQVSRFERLLLTDATDAIRAAVQNYQARLIDGLELFETLRTFRTIQLEHVRALLNYELALNDLAVAE